MVKLNSLEAVGAVGGSGSGTGDGLFIMLASIGVLICMVSTLMGIKFWWFKHRLTFNHNTTNNGAAGGATPTVPLRTRSSREKRLSQQISEPVEVHGVFRQRQDNDLDIVPTKQLPPVRIRNLSKSTSSLFPPPPPRRQDKVRSVIFEEYELPEPPTREPPRPPVDLTRPPTDSFSSPAGSPQTRTPALSLAEEMPTFDELEQKYRQMELVEEEQTSVWKEASTESIFRKRDSPPQPPLRLNRYSDNGERLVGMQKFVKSKSPSKEQERFQQKLTDRHSMGVLRADEKNMNTILAEADSLPSEVRRSASVEEFGERRPTGYIKYEEIDVAGLEDLRVKWDKMQTSLNAESITSYPNYDQINQASTRGPRTVAYADDIQQLGGANEGLESKCATSESQESIAFTSDEEFADELDGVKPKMMLKSASLANFSFNGFKDEVPPPGTVTTPIHQETFADPHIAILDVVDEEDNFEKRQPNDKVEASHSEKLWNELEANIKQDERDKRLWLEIEKTLDLNREFVSNIEEEFDKIRHSYEENEAAFLENTGSLKRVPEQVSIVTPEPEGFGKSIDEDWENFETLAIEKPIAPVGADERVVQFHLSELEDAYDTDKDLALHTERRPTDLVRKSAPFKRELSNIEDVSEPTSPHYSESRVEFGEQDNERYAMPWKEQHPTSYARTEISDLDDEDYVHEHNKKSIFEPVEEPLTVTVPTQADAQPRPRQKVTFDFTSTEYYQASNDDEEEEPEERRASKSFSATTKYTYSDSESADEDTAAQTWPKPMQRVTKTHYIAKTNENDRSITELKVPNSYPTEIDMKDSWTVRRHRQEMRVTNVEEQPKPALRNTTVTNLILMEESVVTQSPISHFKPHAAVRQQYFEQSYTNSTEA